MPLTMFDLEKVNQMMNQQQQQQSDNMSYLLSAGAMSKSNLIASALLQQFQQSQSQLNSKLFSNNLILNCIQANAAQLLTAQSTENQKQINYSRYKTELCRQFIENGECKYGDKCQFAHGMDDLKDVNRHPKYKTDYCKTFHSKGFCPYGPRCHFIHELHEKFDPSIQNVSVGKKTKDVSAKSEDTQIIDKQLEAIQAQLTSSLFVAEESNDNFTINDSKKQLVDSGSEKPTVQTESNSNNSFSSGPSSPVTSSSISASSYASTSNSTSVSSSTSPVSRVIKKPMTLQEQSFYSTKTNQQQVFFDSTIKTIFDNTPLNKQPSRSTSPLLTARTRSSVSSTSSACSSSSSSSFEFLCDENTTIGSDAFSPVKQQVKQTQQHNSLRASFNSAVPISAPKNLGPIGRPQVNVNNVNSLQSSQNMFDIERINSLLIQQQNKKSKVASGSFNKNLSTSSQNNSGNGKSFFPMPQDFGAYGKFYQSSSHSSW